MRLTLDWDDPSEMQGNLDTIRDRYEEYPWELRRSSSGDGFHLVVYELMNDTRKGVESNGNLREVYDDDPKRLSLDRHRWSTGSPFYQVLYQRKYMERDEWPAQDGTGYSTGHAAEVIEQSRAVKAAPERERVKDPDTGRINYQKALDLALEGKGWSAADLSDYLGSRDDPNVYADESGGRSASTVRDYLRGQRDVQSDAIRRWVRRQIRSQGIGHMTETRDGGRAAEEVRWIDPEDERRTLVEYIDVPIGIKESGRGKEYDELDSEDREYGLLNVHTGTFNDAHTDRQLKNIHEDVTEHVLEVLSPTSPDGVKMGGPSGLEEQNNHFQGVSGWTREFDSVNWERELLDDGEADVYVDNLPSHRDKPDNPENYPMFEVILWDEDMDTMEWQVIGLWTGESVSDATILKDRGLGVW